MIEKFLKIQWWNWSIEKIEKNIELFYQPQKFVEIFYKNYAPKVDIVNQILI